MKAEWETTVPKILEQNDLMQEAIIASISRNDNLASWNNTTLSKFLHHATATLSPCELVVKNITECNWLRLFGVAMVHGRIAMLP